MKHAYRLLALAGLMALSLPAAQAQNWRPFRPGLIYSYDWSTTNATHTLRLDSAYAAGSDSVYTFNRVLRPTGVNTFQLRPSLNNILGARLICRPAQREYVLETVAETGTAAQSLVLRPQAAVGSNWAATPSLTATLTARTLRTWGLAPNTFTDSVATITLSNGRLFELSRSYGLLRAPANWPGASGVDLMQGNMVPVPYQNSVYSPLVLLNFQPGDELGYVDEDYGVFTCYSNYELRRFLTRQQTADSLIYTYQVQTEYNRRGGGNNNPCGSASQYTRSPVQVRRLALPLRRPQWVRSADVLNPADLGLLTYEYAPLTTGGLLIMGEAGRGGTGACPIAGRQLVSYARMYTYGTGTYTYGVDAGGGTHEYAAGVGETRRYQWMLRYYRKQLPNGSYATCGSNANFTTLLPTRTAQAAARFAVYPNPAAHEAAIRIATPAPAGTRLTLHDATGRCVGQWDVNQGQTAALVPLSHLPAGVYLVQLHLPGEAPVALRLQHLP